MVQRSDSVLRHVDVPPFKHPHFQTFRERQRMAFVREVETAVRLSDDMRMRLQSRRILETIQ
ncbi:hypothetical protein [Pseudochrobactrum asaccharolyticum]|uniref:Uncharacterized protein n=1 Tax=Pseudochrobactrum asaccharolyticum TaxID=354351 RepID=A0A366DLY2_9HYPH|nr:hypothetical protein [Pseudochrobactrum asaccharolyticum]RBO90499.1 hypothetical protein DFR47_11360 [Pseudochrobactrum asaccharolyticum]